MLSHSPKNRTDRFTSANAETALTGDNFAAQLVYCHGLRTIWRNLCPCGAVVHINAITVVGIEERACSCHDCWMESVSLILAQRVDRAVCIEVNKTCVESTVCVESGDVVS
jgi:hypothetical protein